MPAPGLDEALRPYRGAVKQPAHIANLLAKILASATPAQLPFITDPHRKLSLLTPRRAGKTSGMLRRFAKGALERRRGRYLYFALSRPTAEELLWDPLKEFADQLEIPSRFYESSLTMEFKDTGSTIQLVGADDKKECDKKRGQKYDGAGVDESASFSTKLLRYLLDQVLRWALMDLRGWLAMVGTPGNILAGEFYDATRVNAPNTRPWGRRHEEDWADAVCRCASGEKCTSFKWSGHSWTLQDNTAAPHIWEEALAEKEQEGWTDENPIWQREALGRWVADETGRVYRFRARLEDGTPWNIWTPGERTAENPFGLPLGHEWRFTLGGDLGTKKIAQEKSEKAGGRVPGGKRLDKIDRNKTILELLAYADTCKDLYHVLEVQKAMHVTALANEIKRIEELCEGRLDGTYIDVGYRSGGGMIVDELGEVHGLSAEVAEKAKKNDAIELTNADLVDGRLKLLPGSIVIEEMETLQWDESGEKENSSQANDGCDAVIYGRRGSLHHHAEEPPVRPQLEERRAAHERAREEADENETQRHAAKPRQSAEEKWFNDGRPRRRKKAWFGETDVFEDDRDGALEEELDDEALA